MKARHMEYMGCPAQCKTEDKCTCKYVYYPYVCKKYLAILQAALSWQQPYAYLLVFRKSIDQLSDLGSPPCWTHQCSEGLMEGCLVLQDHFACVPLALLQSLHPAF